jgi:hypothetical protein
VHAHGEKPHSGLQATIAGHRGTHAAGGTKQPSTTHPSTSPPSTTPGTPLRNNPRRPIHSPAIWGARLAACLLGCCYKIACRWCTGAFYCLAPKKSLSVSFISILLPHSFFPLHSTTHPFPSSTPQKTTPSNTITTAACIVKEHANPPVQPAELHAHSFSTKHCLPPFAHTSQRSVADRIQVEPPLPTILLLIAAPFRSYSLPQQSYYTLRRSATIRLRQ